MALTKTQLEELVETIRKRFISFRYEALGERALTQAEVDTLIGAGLLRRGTRNMVADPNLLGRIVALLPPSKRSAMTYDQVLNIIQRIEPDLTGVERRAIEYASDHAGEFIRGIEDMAVKTARTATARARMDALRAVQEGVKDAIANRKTVSQLKGDLYEMLDDRYRDWQRVAHTEINTAIQQGIYHEIRDKSDEGSDQLVFKRPSPDACFISGTMIQTKNGPKDISDVVVGDMVLTHKMRWRRVTFKFKNKYSGWLYGINGTANATANHPFLVNLDWERADSVKTGDQIVGFRSVNSDDKPSIFPKKFFFNRISISNLRSVMPSSTVNLYSDLQRRDSNINVEFSDGVFKDWSVAREAFSYFNRFLSSSCHVVLSCFGFLSQSFRCGSHGSCATGIFSDPLSVTLGRTGESLTSGLPTRFKLDPIGNQTPLNDTTTDVKFSSKRGKINSHLRILFDKFFFVKIDDVDFRHMPTSELVESVVSEHFTGHVYNIEVEDDASYFADGIAVHNCKHCKRVYLREDGVTPKIFKLSELAESNVGLKASNWKPTIGSVHPWCHCQLHVVPEGYDFVNRKVAKTGFDHGGEKIKAGQILEDNVYSRLSSEDKEKTREDAILTYTGIER